MTARLAALLAVLLLAAPARALDAAAPATTGAPVPARSPIGAEPFLTAGDVDLLRLLEPPPAEDSRLAREELAEVLRLQATRTPAMEARAAADATEEPWVFAEAAGAALRPEGLPLTAALFERLKATEGTVVDPAKDAFARRRPHQASDLVRPVVRRSNSGAWPSGHATYGALIGIVLADMIPERRGAILARAREYGENRLVAGIHRRGDVEAGRVAGAAIAAVLMTRPDFREAYAPARAELRAALGL